VPAQVAPQPAQAAPQPAQVTPQPAQVTPQPSAPPPDRSMFAALWVTPFATNHFQGAGTEVGFRYRWLIGLYRIGFLQNGYEPVSGTPLLTLERTQRLSLDLEVNARWRFSKKATLAAGGGIGILNDWVDVTSMNGLAWTTATDDRLHVRPLVGITLAGPLFQATATAYLGFAPEGAVSLGFYWGRR
jgi:hypothetical protein